MFSLLSTKETKGHEVHTEPYGKKGSVFNKMRHNSRSLAMRDPALAALTGAITGADFGHSRAPQFGDDYGDDSCGFGFGDEGFGFGAAAAAAKHPVAALRLAQAGMRPTAAQAMGAWQKQNVKAAIGKSRQVLLDPNADSDVKIERYLFGLSQAFTIGTSAAFDANLNQSPSTDFRPQMMVVNAPAPGFALADTIAIANVLVSVGGSVDLFNFASGQAGTQVDFPTMTPSNKARFTGSYTGFIPPGYLNASSFTLTITLIGPASLAGGRVNQGS